MSHSWYCTCLLKLSGDNELKLSPKPNSFKSFSICQVSFLTAYKSIYKFGLMFVYLRRNLNYEILSNNENLNVPDYNLIRVDHLSNTKVRY